MLSPLSNMWNIIAITCMTLNAYISLPFQVRNPTVVPGRAASGGSPGPMS